MTSKRGSKELYKAWRNAVVKRDKNKCQMPGCNKRGREAHHIRRWADAPYLRYEVDNGILLCKACHDSIKDKEHFYISLFYQIVSEKR